MSRGNVMWQCRHMARDHSFLWNRNFELSRRICQFPQNFYVFAEFCRIQYWPVLRRQIQRILVGCRKLTTICRHDFAMIYMSATWAVMEYWKYWAELVWNIASLFRRQTVSVSCGCQWQMLLIWSGSGGRKFGKFDAVSRTIWQSDSGIWRNLP